MSCSICFDDFNASNHKQICCPFDACAKTACRTCYETFLCGDDVSVPKCMFCNTSFTHSQVQHLGFTKAFLKGKFAKHQQDILFAQEQAMLPAAQAAVALDRAKADIHAQIKLAIDQIKKLQQHNSELRMRSFQLSHQFYHDDSFDKSEISLKIMENKALKKDNYAQIRQLKELKDDLYLAKHRIIYNRLDDNDATAVQQFIHRCADSECNGFVSSAWKCATCDKHTCSHCRELKTDDHVCNPDTVASVAMLKKDTKPCPNCKVLVHKTEGCDQMFCTQCKRLWSWNTGKFETHGHNPHYLQWMRGNGGMPRDPNDVLCGREVDHAFIRQLHAVFACKLASVQENKQLWLEKSSILTNFINHIPHLRFHDLPRFQVDRLAMNLKSRKSFVSNSLSLARFKQTIRRNQLTAIKYDNIHQIIQAVIQAATDISFRILHHIPSSTLHSLDSFILEFHNLITYANHELSIIHHDFLSTQSQRSFLHPNSFKLINFFSNPSKPLDLHL